MSDARIGQRALVRVIVAVTVALLCSSSVELCLVWVSRLSRFRTVHRCAGVVRRRASKARWDDVDTMYPDLPKGQLAVLAKGDRWAAVYNPAGLIAHHHTEFRDKTVPLVKRFVRTFGHQAHLVHRLDRGTSGISLVAFDAEACAAMHGALVGPSSQKTYYAVCRSDGSKFQERGVFNLNRPLRDVSNRNHSLRSQMKEASTDVEVLFGGRDPDCCLVRAQPRTGRYHQIRRHLRNITLPILGDDYAKKQIQKAWSAVGHALPDRVLLHLHRVQLPATEFTPAIDVRCPLPPDFADLLRRACATWAPEAEAALPELFAEPPPNLAEARPQRRLNHEMVDQ
eukprot:TRINITY_DN42056_c0_g1_i2.p1 TRINITY_DN42056_c0_g1~~TRINITY_DN42056_c0_g1_i2.p1  ORF type:complete len:340 (+),score=13.08 TRINITY_DN42056_c0_g1_i2:129-1148(+)